VISLQQDDPEPQLGSSKNGVEELRNYIQHLWERIYMHTERGHSLEHTYEDAEFVARNNGSSGCVFQLILNELHTTQQLASKELEVELEAAVELAELAGASFSEITTERATAPASAPATITRAKSVGVYEAKSPDQCSLAEGEIVAVLSDATQWWVIRNSAGHEGKVPMYCFTPVDEPTFSSAPAPAPIPVPAPTPAPAPAPAPEARTDSSAVNAGSSIDAQIKRMEYDIRALQQSNRSLQGSLQNAKATHEEIEAATRGEFVTEFEFDVGSAMDRAFEGISDVTEEMMKEAFQKEPDAFSEAAYLAIEAICKEIADDPKIEMQCPVCFGRVIEEGGDRQGLWCLNNHDVCLKCIKSLVAKCEHNECWRTGNCTGVKWKCPVCRVWSMLEPVHLMAAIKGSWDGDWTIADEAEDDEPPEEADQEVEDGATATAAWTIADYEADAILGPLESEGDDEEEIMTEIADFPLQVPQYMQPPVDVAQLPITTAPFLSLGNAQSTSWPNEQEAIEEGLLSHTEDAAAAMHCPPLGLAAAEAATAEYAEVLARRTAALQLLLVSGALAPGSDDDFEEV
jgi:hypothetical protein